MTESTEPTDCQTAIAVAGVPGGCGELPTRQKNVRHLLGQPVANPADVARLGYRALERGPGVGWRGIETILTWLRAHGHGYGLSRLPTQVSAPRVLQRKLERAISYLRERGCEVRSND